MTGGNIAKWLCELHEEISATYYMLSICFKSSVEALYAPAQSTSIPLIKVISI